MEKFKNLEILGSSPMVHRMSFVGFGIHFLAKHFLGSKRKRKETKKLTKVHTCTYAWQMH